MNIPTNHSYVLGIFSIDVSQRRLNRGAETIHLTNRPFNVLVYLIENRDRVVSRGELLDRFWEGQNVYDVTLTKCIGAIRKALDDKQEEFIETLYGDGYRYIGPAEEAGAAGDSFNPSSTRMRGRKGLTPGRDHRARL